MQLVRLSQLGRIGGRASGGGDVTAPTLSLASAGTPTSDGATGFGVTTNEGNGTLYWAIVTNGGSCTDTQLKAGSGGNIVAGKAGSQAVTGTGAQTVTSVTGLTASTTYQIKYLHRDAAGNDSSQASVSLTTSSYLPSANPSSLVAWFRKGVGVTVTGSGVSTWADQSGNGRDLVQATDTNRPAYDGSAIITFDGVDNYLKTSAFTLNQPTQISILFSQVSWTLADSVFDGNALNSARLLQYDVTPNLQIYAGSFAAVNTSHTTGTFRAVTVVFNGASSSIKVDSGSETTGNPGAGNAGGFTLGAGGNISTWGNIAVKEVIIRNVDDATIRAADHAYLQTL